ncbi:hypothetical protein PFISCL1PPCAC_23695 [Pristionchus fissidentatus]|uniref:MAGE domain-containing protein n=1 Tax=Pristionchus fissidentatus TaxID=1538716 RepID=A0AAV5WQ48_9BILA|nr:hypothetical protein PFISCL1PPCAC_23695 [Pristionchus fissidentatus]
MSGRGARVARKRRTSGSGDDEDESVDSRVQEIAHCVLSAHSRKGGMKDAEVKKALSRDAMHISEKQLLDVLGCKLLKDGERHFIYHDRKMPAASQGMADVTAEAKQGLLSIVLMFIHMSKNPVVKTDRVKEFALWEFLEQLEVVQTALHPVFGLPSKLIAPMNSAEFVAQGWLSFEKLKGDRDTEEIYYDWGPRAHTAIDPQEMLELFCEISGDKKEEWKEHVKVRRSSTN